jgi:hypothetical protein
VIIVVLVKKNSDKMITVMEVVRWLRSDYSHGNNKRRCVGETEMIVELIL